MPDTVTQDSESEIHYPPSIVEDVTKLVQRVQTFTGATGAAIALREGEDMVCRASRGSNAPDVGMILSLEGTFAGLAVTGMKALRCDDAENDPRTDPEVSRALRIRSMAVVPVLSGTRVSGVIATFSSTVNAFSDTHMAVLKTMADGLGAAIQRWLETSAPAPSAQRAVAPPPPPPPRPEPPRVETPRVEAPKPAPPPPPPPPVRQAAPPVPPPAPKIEAPKPAPKIEPPKPVLKPVAAAAAPAPAMEKPVEKQAPKKPELKQQGKWKPVTLPKEEEAAPEPKAQPKKSEPKPEPKSEPAPFSYGMDQQSEGGKGKLIGIAAAVLLVVVGGGYYFYSSSQKPKPAPAPVTAAAPATTATSSAPVATQPVASSSSTSASSSASSSSQSSEPESKPATPAMRVQAPAPSRSNASAQDVAAPQIAFGGGAGPNLAMPSSGNVPRLAAPVQSSVVIPSRLVQRVNPIYPQLAAANRASGQVTMTGTIGTDGRVKDVKVVSGHPLLRDAAVQAFKQWKYAPSTVNGRAVDSPVTVTVAFKRAE